MNQSYAYYPGCSALKSATELDLAVRKVMTGLGLSWTVLDQAACCGSRECGGLRVENERFALANNARTLSMAEAIEAKTLINVCSTCQLELAGDNKRLQEDPALLEEVNDTLNSIGRHYSGSVQVKNFLYVLLEDIGFDKVAKAVKKTLTGLRIAPFYGCHLLRPSEIHGSREDPYKPRSLGNLIEVLGAEEVQYDGASRCCGFHAILISEKPSLQMSGLHLLEAKENGADLIVTPCPLCHSVLDTYQPSIEGEMRKRINLPVLHLPQLVGIAMGMDPETLGIGRHMIDPREILRPYLSN
jgi:succinate dehydrogenase / fumarate reductase cytochrome b subunit